LTATPILPPIHDALRSLRRELIGDIAQKEEVGSADFHADLQGADFINEK
jgi:hypothetical protein